MTAAYLLKNPITPNSLWECDMEAALTKQVGGSHYSLMIQPVDFIVKNNILDQFKTARDHSHDQYMVILSIALLPTFRPAWPSSGKSI